MNIAFFISNYGFGHLMRNLPVIGEMLKTSGNRIILVTGRHHLEIACEYFQAEGIEMSALMTVECDTDRGFVLKPGSLEVDAVDLRAEITNFVDTWPGKIESAKALLKRNSIDCVVVDIVPWALIAAHEQGIPSYLMASFTWIEQYEPFFDDVLLNKYREAYSLANHVLQYALNDGYVEQYYPSVIPVGLACRPIHPDIVEGIKQSSDYPIVFLSIGRSNDGIGETIDVSGLPYTFITTPGLKLQGDNVRFLPVKTNNTQDFIAGSDYCISKAGWTTVAEMLVNRKPMALIRRTDVVEDTAYIERLEAEGHCISIDVEELKDINMILKKLRQHSFLKQGTEYQNDIWRIQKLIGYA